MRKLGQKLRMLRENRGLTLRQLGAAIDASHSHLVLIESGKRLPSLDLFVKLVEYYQVSADQLLDDKAKLDL